MSISKMPISPRLAVAALGLALNGCAVVQSSLVDDTRPTPDGTIYFLPLRPFLVSVAKPAATKDVPDPPAAVTVQQGPAVADLSQRFVLVQGDNWLAKSELNVTVGTNGLLKTGNSSATSEVATALQSVASAAGAFAGLAPGGLRLGLTGTKIAPVPPADGCPLPGMSYQYLIYPEGAAGQLTRFCGFTVAWIQAQKSGSEQHSKINCAELDKKPAAVGETQDNRRMCESDSSQSGVFYRHELPYVVSVTGPEASPKSVVAQYLLTSPDQSEIDFLPVKRSFFANNTANIKMTDGIVTDFDQTTEGELTAALALPASVLNSYTTAIGSMLGNLTNNSNDLQKLLAQQQATASAQSQATVCQMTIAANPLDKLKGDELTKAAATIAAACGSSK
jgi:hypothetical protein